MERPRTDGQLVRECLKGDERAADELARRHYPRVWRAALGVTGEPSLAEDAAQDAFERAIRRLERFDRTRSFGPWVGQIAVNCAIDIVTKRSREAAMGDHETEIRDHLTSGRSAERIDLVQALQALPVEQRAVVILRLYLGYDPRETAEAIGVEVGTVHSRLSRARTRLAELLRRPIDV